MDEVALAIQVRHRPGYTVITLAGEIDVTTAPRLRKRLTALASSGRPVVADLNQASFLDTAGLGVLAAAAQQAAASGGSLHIVSPRHQVRRILTLTGMDQQLSLAPTQAAALASLPVAQGTGP
jgi:anti-sigma B factor antagonist